MSELSRARLAAEAKTHAGQRKPDPAGIGQNHLSKGRNEAVRR